MSQNELPRTSNFWSNNQYTFDVPTGLGLLDEDFELPVEQNSQSNNPQELVIPATPTVFPSTQQSQPSRTLPSTPTFLDPYSPSSSNDSSILECSSPPIYQSPTQQVPPPMSPNSRHFYPPTYMHHPYYNPHMLADPECFARFIAEEDKRKRNTAASARFRIKKKMREQNLEKTARDMTAKAEMLDNRVKELEREIKWLKDLLIEKDSRILDIQRSDNNNNSGGSSDSTSDQQRQK